MLSIVTKKMQLILLTLQVVISLVWGTDRPIIGILTQEVNPKAYPNYSSCIVASYVKAVEQTGARVAPIFINRTEEYYRKLLDSLNGVLLPGGGVNFADVGGYADAGRIIVNYTKEANARGDHFPILGVCLGFELLFYLEVESYGILDYCNSSNLSLPLKFKNMYEHSRLFHRAPRHIINILSYLPVAYNYHKRCVTEEALKKYELDKTYQVLSTSVDRDGKEFISSMETYQYPIAGVQFHPEKNAYEWNAALNISHSQKAVISGRYFMDWLVSEARKNSHSFNNSELEPVSLIYNYSITYEGGYYEQIYFFE